MSRLTKRNATLKASCKENSTYDCLLEDDCITCDCNNKILEKLAHYEDLGEQGRLIELPCKVGTEVFFITSNEKIYSTTLGTIESVLRHGDAIGDGLYLTKAEAEAKLAELQSFPTLPILHGNVAPSSKEEAMKRFGLKDKMEDLKGE